MTWQPQEVRPIRDHPLPQKLLEVRLESDNGEYMLLRFSEVDREVRFHHEKVYDTVEIHNVNEQAIKAAAEYINERLEGLTVYVSVTRDDGEQDIITADRL